MNHFTAHPHQQGITYFQHWRFATRIALRLLISALSFVLHAMLPFISIGSRLNLESTAAYSRERNRWIEAAEGSVHHDARPGPALGNPGQASLDL